MRPLLPPSGGDLFIDMYCHLVVGGRLSICFYCYEEVVCVPLLPPGGSLCSATATWW